MKFSPEIERHRKVISWACALAAVGVIWGVLELADSDRTAPQSKISPTVQRGKTPSDGNERYSQVLEDYNRTNGEMAKQSGQSFLSVMEHREAKAPSPETIIPPAPPPPTVIYVPQPQTAGRYDKDLEQNAKALVAHWEPKGHGAASVSEDGVIYASSLHTAQSEAASDNKAPTVKIVEDYALVPAILETALDTDENSVVSAYVPSGTYQGARLFAMGYKRITNTIDMTFTSMEWNGVSYKVTAKPVDSMTMRTSLSGEVNDRYFSRIVLPAIANGIAKVGGLYEQASSQNVITSNGAVIQTYPETPDGRNVAGTILGGTAEHAGNVMAADAAKIPVKQITLERGTTIGIRFIGPVLSSDAIAPAAAATGGGTGLEKASEAPAGDTNYPTPNPGLSQRQYPYVIPAYPQRY